MRYSQTDQPYCSWTSDHCSQRDEKADLIYFAFALITILGYLTDIEVTNQILIQQCINTSVNVQYATF